MIAEWETNCVYLPGQLPTSHPMVCQGLQRAFKDHGIELHLLQGTKDIWLRDFLPTSLPEARILTYGYNSGLVLGKSVSEIPDFARGLLENIHMYRRKDSKTVYYYP